MVRPSTVARLAARWTAPRTRARVSALPLPDAGHGYDAFGAQRDWIAFGAGLTRGLYERWFRVTSHGIEHLPADGPGILAANHSGVLPYDAAMIWADVLDKSQPARVVRPVMDHFVPLLPIVGTAFARAGGVGGSRDNVRHLLEAGELLLIFPEGTVGIGKPFAQRYQLQTWRVGHAEFAIRHRAPVIPTAVIGAEEQMPQLARIDAPVLGVPYLPIPATPVPLPVRYHVYYGPPIDLAARYRPEDADDPAALEEAAATVKAAVAELIAEGRAARAGVFA